VTLRRVRVEGGLEVQYLDQDGRRLPMGSGPGLPVCPVPAADHPRRPRFRRVERLGPLGATHAEPDDLHTLRAVIETPTQRA